MLILSKNASSTQASSDSGMAQRTLFRRADALAARLSRRGVSL